MRFALLVALAAGCAGPGPSQPVGSTQPPPPATGSAPTEPAPPATKPDPAPPSEPPATPAPDPATPKPTGPGIGEKCGPADACAPPATCVTYYGIAGPRGPAFKSCEVKCTPKSTACPDGRKCTTIADGPGSVCR